MLRLPMTAIAVLASFSAPLASQDNFGALEQRLAAERDALMRSKDGRPAFEDVKRFAARAAEQIEAFLQKARGDDSANARLLLANVWVDVGDEAAAKKALAGFDPETTPPLALAAAAELATRVGAADLRARFCDAATKKAAPFEQRMALAIFLATRLVEVERAEAIFTKERESAADDEAKARLLWYHATCTRQREDVEEDAWLEELKTLAETHPETYWGGVARDRRRAIEQKAGDAAIPFRGTTLDGAPLALADLEGKVVLVEFWGDRADRAAPFLVKLHEDFAARGLALVGVAAVLDRARATELVQASKRSWPQLFDGRGPATDLALRWGVERLPEFVLIDRKGKLVLPTAWLDDADGRTELRDAILRALSDG